MIVLEGGEWGRFRRMVNVLEVNEGQFGFGILVVSLQIKTDTSYESNLEGCSREEQGGEAEIAWRKDVKSRSCQYKLYLTGGSEELASVYIPLKFQLLS